MVLDQLECPDGPEHIGHRDDAVSDEHPIVVAPPVVRAYNGEAHIEHHQYHRDQVDDVEESPEEVELARPYDKLEQQF